MARKLVVTVVTSGGRTWTVRDCTVRADGAFQFQLLPPPSALNEPGLKPAGSPEGEALDLAVTWLKDRFRSWGGQN
jgi:hypothetical protein